MKIAKSLNAILLSGMLVGCMVGPKYVGSPGTELEFAL